METCAETSKGLRRPNGCYECSQRRVVCDKSEPHCQKCLKKGLKCTGQGIRIRFADGLARKRSRKSDLFQSSPSPNLRASITQQQLRWDVVPVKVDRARISRKRHLTGTDFGETKRANRHSDWLAEEQNPEKTHPDAPEFTPANTLDFSQLDHLKLPSVEAPDILPAGSLDFSPAESRDLSSTGSLDFSRTVDRLGFHESSSSCLLSITHIELVGPQTRMLLHHFSVAVAPIMVVLDCVSNGYRDIILPLAVEDPVVQRAVTVVAAHHLASKMPELEKPALQGQMAIISKLRRDSLNMVPDRVFSLSNLVTVLVLLVGDTVTGGSDFVHLLEMLIFLTQSTQTWAGLTDQVRDFFSKQVKMFEFFGFPMAQEQKGAQVLQNKQGNYLDFLDYSVSPFSKHFEPLQIMRAAIEDASEIYSLRAESKLTECESIARLDNLREKTMHLHEEIDGAHALVWTYFVAAAESFLNEHREYFTSRLKRLYERTRFRSIPVAIDALQKLWSVGREERWTELLVKELPVLVM